MGKIELLDEDRTKLLTIDARVAAIRWDLVPWCLVFDLDVPVSEANMAPMYRAWIVFEGVSDMFLPILNSRLPNGCCLVSEISASKLADDFHDYRFVGLLPSFSNDDLVLNNPSKDIVIKSKNIIGIRSMDTGVPNNGYLERKVRNDLASDDEFLLAFMSRPRSSNEI